MATNTTTGADAAAGGQMQQQAADVSYAFAAGNLSSSAYWTPNALQEKIGTHLDPAIPETTLFAESKHIPLPDELLRARYQTKSRSYMGLFPEIRHAWITIDGSLHLWDYERNPGTFILAKEYPTLITAVALVTPPPSLFVDNVKYLLVVATLSEIHVDCVRFTKSASLLSPPAVGLSDMDMHVPADGVSVTAITSTREGRIFLGGYDGHVYELKFVPDTRLLDRIPIFGSGSDPSRHKLLKTNHTQSTLIKCLPDFIAHRLDNKGPIKSLTVHNDKGVLIVLYESRIISSSTGEDDGGALKIIQLWDQAVDEKSKPTPAFKPILDVPSLMRQATNNVIHHSRDFYLGKGSSVISLHPIESSESTAFHFVAVTSTATRLYCSFQQKNTVSIELVANHVRLPPTSQPISQSLGSPARYNVIPTATSLFGGGAGGGPAGGNAGPLHLRNPVADNFMPVNTHAAYYARGVFLACHATGTDVGGSGSSPADMVLGAALDLPRDLPQLTRTSGAMSRPTEALERAHIVHIAGRTAALAEIDPTTGGALDSVATATFPVDEQDRPRHFLLLNSDGLRVLVKRRPLDELAYLVRMGADKLPERFVQAYGRAQVCAWLIALACGDVGGVAPNLAPSTLAGGVGGGFGMAAPAASRMSNTSGSRLSGYGVTPLTPAARLHVIQRMFHHAGGQPHPLAGSPAERTDLGSAVQQVNVQVSGCALGLDMYLRHMLQPIWDAAVLRKNPQHQGYEMAVNEGELTRIEAKLEKLSGFVDEWPKRKELFESPFANAGAAGGMPRPGTVVQPGDEYCWNREREYVQGLFHHVKLALEAVRFVRLLAAYKLPEVVQRAPSNTSHPQTIIDYLLSTPMRDFAVSAGGRVMCGQIATLAIQYAPMDGVGARLGGGAQGQQQTGGSLAALLQEWCSTLLSVEDVFAAGVLESIKMYREQAMGDSTKQVSPEEWARNVVNPRSPVLADALAKALRVAGKLNDTHFVQICEGLLGAGFVRGVLDLALRRANELDPNAEAVQFMREEATGGVLPGDPRERLVVLRNRCYLFATGALERLNHEVAVAQATIERDGQAANQQQQQQQAFELKAILTDSQVRVHQHAEASNDLLWHFALYDWYQKLGKASALVGLSTVYVEEWLKRQDTVEGQEMLARYYEARGRYADAARTMLSLARIPVALAEAEQQQQRGDNSTFTYKLEDRIAHLSSALQVAKATKNATLIQEIAEEYDVAHVQGQLVRSLSMLEGNKDAQVVARELTDGELVPLQELLYIAGQFELPTLTFQLVAVGNPPEREVDLMYLRDLWFEALRPAATESLTAAVVTLTDLFSYGGYVAPASSAAEALADFPTGGVPMAYANVSTSAALFNPEVWIEVVLNLTQTSPKLEFHPTWWVDIAARASVVDMANVTAELLARTTRAAMEDRNQLLKVLVAAMKAWSQSGQVAWRSWGVQIEECALLVQRTQGVDEAIRREIEQLASEELPTNGFNASFMPSAGW